VLPDIPAGIPSQLRPLLAGIRENLQLLNWGLSVKGDVVKLQQQVSSLTQITVNLDSIPVAPPTEVTGVNVAALSSVISVDWFYPIYAGHHYTEIFVQQSTATDGLPDYAPDFNENRLWQVSLSAGASLPIPIQAHAGVYIWLRHVNKQRQVGPLYTHGFVVIPMSADVILDIVGDSIDFSNLNTNTQSAITDLVLTNELHIQDVYGNTTANIKNNTALFDAKTFAVRDTSNGGTGFTMALHYSNIDGVWKNRVHMNDVVIGDARIENVKVTGTKNPTTGAYSTELTNVHVLGASKFSGEVDITGGTIKIGDNFEVFANGDAKVKGQVEADSLKANIIMVGRNNIPLTELSKVDYTYYPEKKQMRCLKYFKGYGGSVMLFNAYVYNNSDYYCRFYIRLWFSATGSNTRKKIYSSTSGRVSSKIVSTQTATISLPHDGTYQYEIYLVRNDYPWILMNEADQVRIGVTYTMHVR
jgi:hypothetical protein